MKFWKLVITATAITFSSTANAVLIERLGGQAYYDTEADLTWLADANAASASMSWEDANAWASNLVVDGVEDWRLPTSDNCFGSYCTNSELGSLFYNVLGNTTTSLDFKGPFVNIQSGVYDYYWTSTNFESLPDYAWVFHMGSGYQTDGYMPMNYTAWAVHTGDVGVVPVPAAAWLFGSGLIGLIGFARRRKI